VLYSNSLEATHAEIEKVDGQIIKSILVFWGGRRFHFTDSNGNKYAGWSG
jgi:uncharacterized protein